MLACLLAAIFAMPLWVNLFAHWLVYLNAVWAFPV